MYFSKVTLTLKRHSWSDNDRRRLVRNFGVPNSMAQKGQCVPVDLVYRNNMCVYDLFTPLFIFGIQIKTLYFTKLQVTKWSDMHWYPIAHFVWCHLLYLKLFESIIGVHVYVTEEVRNCNNNFYEPCFRELYSYSYLLYVQTITTNLWLDLVNAPIAREQSFIQQATWKGPFIFIILSERH